jgi:acyl-phosphate glycerol 3-phosphate acyltransferase
MDLSSIILIVVAYLLGSVSFAILVSHFFHLKDPRYYGSNNPGATNVMRSGNKLAALLTLLGDALKGFLIVFIAIHYHFSPLTIALVSIAVVLGHMFPIFFKFQGGKGVATAIGVIYSLSWPVGLIMCVLWLILVFITRISSLSALITYLACPLLSLYFLDEKIYQVTLTMICLLVIMRHKDNIIKLLQRKENKVGK